MRGTVSHQDWVTEVGGLTIRGYAGDPRDEIGEALADVARLRAAAAGYVASAHCAHAQGTCGLDSAAGGREACDLAAEIAAEQPPATGGIAPAVAAARWLDALRDSCRAVWLCRRIAHPAGQCWFAPPDHTEQRGLDLCGHILGVTHRLG